MEPQEGELRPAPKFKVSDYRDGIYQPNGTFSPERLLSDRAIAQWERDNQQIMRGKGWGLGQALFFEGQPLIFGRDANAVDVRVDVDPGPDGGAQHELGVSRRHFQLTPPSQGRIQITDLGSTNGVKVFSKEGPLKADLNRERPEAILEVGDFALIGGGEVDPANPYSRLIGFRVCADAKGKMFLVKFNVENEDDLLAMVGKVRKQEQARISLTERSDLKEPVRIGYESLLSLIGKVKVALKLESSEGGTEVIRSQARLVLEAFNIVDRIAKDHLDGDLSDAILYLGVFALNKGEELYEQGDKENSARALEVSSFLSKLARGEFIQQIGEG